MTRLQTLKLGASSIGATAPRHIRPAAPVVEEITVVEEPAAVEPAAPAPVEAPARTAPRTARVPVGRNQLLAILALGALATLAAVEATGAVHSNLIRFATILLAGVVGAAVLAGAAVAYNARKPKSAAAPVAAAAPRKQGFSTSKAILMLMMVMGIVAYFGGAGTFAGFTAETSNPNDTLASGTLILRNNVNTNCDSTAGESNNNVNANCNVALTFSNQEPGVYTGTATVTLTNTGSLAASRLYLWAPWSNGVMSGATIGGVGQSSITSGQTVQSIQLAASGHGPAGLEGPVAAGDQLTLTSGGYSQTFCASAAAAAGATTVSIGNNSGVCTGTTAVASYNFAQYATLQDTSSNTVAGTAGPPAQSPNTNCYDQQTSVGNAFSFNAPTYNPLCNATLLYVQETTGGKNYCWFGNTSHAPTGGCTAPIKTSPSAGSLSSGQVANGSYTVTALTGNIKNGDNIAFTEGGNTVNCTASADYYVGTTSITVAGCAAASGSTNTGFDYTSNDVITDTAVVGALASDTSHTVSQFDLTKNYNLKQELTAVSSNGSASYTGVDLAAGASRTFVVGVFIPGPASSQNQLQGIKSTFGLTWHIDQ